MSRSLTRALLRLVVIGAAVLFFVFHAPGAAKAAATAPNTVISNTASATYTDANNVSYTTNSNTVTTTVQNAPSLTITNTTTQNVSPGEVVTDTFTVTNTGNATAAITINAPTQTGSATIPTNAYVLNGAATGTCSVATPCSLATLNAQTALSAATVGTANTVGVEYTVSTSATPGSTIVTTLTGSSQQAAVGNAPVATSATATAKETDTVLADARLDLYKTATQPTTATGLITFTIAGNDGGGFGAKATYSAGNLLGSTSAGVIAVLDKIPTFTGATTQTTLASAPAVPTLPAGDTGTWYYTTAANGLSGWSTTYTASATYIALFVTTTNTGGIVFPANPAGSSGGGVAQTSSQFTASFQITQPAGNGASDPTALSNVANSVIGGNPGANGTPIIAPGVAVDSQYETGTTPLPASTFTNTVTNTTPSTGTTPPGGASNLVNASAFAQQTVNNGPLDNAAATGSYNGSVAVSPQNDFTDVGYQCTNGPATAVVPPTTPVACTWPTAGVSVPNTFANTGNGKDTFNIYATAPAGYTVQLFAVTGCPTTTPTVLPIAPYGTGCTIGSAISPVSASGGSVTTTAGISVAAGVTYNYVATYQPASGTTVLPFVAQNFSTIVYGSGATVSAGVPTLGVDANQTYNTVYPGGPIKVVKSDTTVPNCPGTPAAATGTVCPGGTITYTLTYTNVASAALATGGAGLGTEPTFATNGIQASGVTIADDGTAGTNNWATTTFGIDAAPAPTFPSGATVTYSPTSTLSTGTYPSMTTGPTKVSVAVGAVQPGGTGTVTFTVTVQ